MAESRHTKRPPTPDDDADSGLPPILKFGLSGVFGLVAFVVLVFMAHYAWRTDAKPSELYLGQVLIFALSAIVLLLVPWDKLDLRVKKVGWLEFQQTTRNQTESIGGVLEDIDQMKRRLKMAPFSEFQQIGELEGQQLIYKAREDDAENRDHLDHLLEKLLQRFPGRYFSASSVIWWGAEQEGFEDLAKHSEAEINLRLQRMVYLKRVVTRVGKNGKIQYSIPVLRS
jgi:hypothetical protein